MVSEALRERLTLAWLISTSGFALLLGHNSLQSPLMAGIKAVSSAPLTYYVVANY